MRFAVFASLVGLAIASSRHWSTDLNEERFRSGKEFRYRFDGQLSAGIPVPNSQNAVTRIQSLITLQPESDGNVRLQLSKIRFAAVQDELRTLSVTPIEHLDNINIDEVRLSVHDRTYMKTAHIFSISLFLGTRACSISSHSLQLQVRTCE